MRETPTLSEGLGKKKEDSVRVLDVQNHNDISLEELNKLNPVLYQLVMSHLLGYTD